MAGDFVQHIRKVCDGPYLVAGYSGGGTVAFEMARQLRAAGESTQALILLDSFCPLDAEPGVSWRLKAHWDGLRSEGMRYAQRRVSARLREKRRQLEDKVFGHKPVVQQSRSMFETAAANWRNIETRYVPKPLAIDAYLLRVESSTADEARYFERRYTAWNQLVTLGVRQLLVPGTHVSMCEEPNVQTLATRLRDVLDPSVDMAAVAQAAQ
jgi:thioesterase domain-containing protein